ncbi:MAG: glycosyltransferase family 4 protein [Bacteroidota bacterium]
MSTILISAYAVDPFRGSEEGMGWNFIRQIARFNKVIAITRENNLPQIQKYLALHEVPEAENIQFVGYDLPKHLRFWKRGVKGSRLYFFLWQRTLPAFIRKQGWAFDIAHNLNFHNDWAPSFLWKLGRPFVWGPVGHHPLIPEDFLKPSYGTKAYMKNRLNWLVKNLFWNSSALKRTAQEADVVFAMNSEVETVLPPVKQLTLMPSVGTEYVEWAWSGPKPTFEVLSIGRFVPMKGFDLTLQAFANFLQRAGYPDPAHVKLVLVGKGPEQTHLEVLADRLKITPYLNIISWVDREKLADIYRRSSVFLFPSHEGAGMVVAEAMSYGLPVVCLENSGPGEFVTKESGKAVPYKTYYETVFELGSNVHQLYAEPQSLEALSKGARHRFESWFDWEVKGEIIREAYEHILQTASAGKQ